MFTSSIRTPEVYVVSLIDSTEPQCTWICECILQGFTLSSKVQGTQKYKLLMHLNRKIRKNKPR